MPHLDQYLYSVESYALTWLNGKNKRQCRAERRGSLECELIHLSKGYGNLWWATQKKIPWGCQVIKVTRKTESYVNIIQSQKQVTIFGWCFSKIKLRDLDYEFSSISRYCSYIIAERYRLLPHAGGAYHDVITPDISSQDIQVQWT